MAGTVPGAKDIKSNYTDSILKKCTSREEDMHVGRQLPRDEQDDDYNTDNSYHSPDIYSVLGIELSAFYVLQHLPFPMTEYGKYF